jgi:preprotein translocase subunit SecY
VFETIRNAWRIPDLRKKLLFTLFILLVYRFGSAIPVPFIDTNALQDAFKSLEGTIFGMMNMMSGGAFSQATIFALSIQPYINASIIMQLLTVGIPALERMVKEGGEEGRKKIASITRYATVALGLLTGFAYYTTIANYGLVSDRRFITAAIIILTFTAGSAFIMWLGEQITEFGIGNGISIILFASIISRGPVIIQSTYDSLFVAKSMSPLLAFSVLVLLLAVIAFIVFITNAERRIPVQYAKRVVGRKMYGGQSTHLPMKVNMSGVLPIIFAQSIASLPATVAAFVPAWSNGWFIKAFNTNTWTYAVIYFLLIVFFAYFYSTIQFNPIEVANNLKKNGGFIPGFRAGKPTSEFIQKVLTKITLFGALYLSVIAITPIIISLFSETARQQGISLGGTSVIIVVGVALDTMKQIEAQMLMRHYKGFLE